MHGPGPRILGLCMTEPIPLATAPHKVTLSAMLRSLADGGMLRRVGDRVPVGEHLHQVVGGRRPVVPVPLHADRHAPLERLNEAYRAAHGHDLSVVSSYRSYGMQVATRRTRGGLAATPGTSRRSRDGLRGVRGVNCHQEQRAHERELV